MPPSSSTSGHGNGWPSPYGNDAAYTTKDGFGLNATAGAGDYNNTYYGEPAIATLALAPGAIVLLNHLCYASGNSEPGLAEPTVSVARQRADNYAAGFLKAGASAVIAEGHAGIESTVRALFTKHTTIQDMWRTMPNQNGHVVSFASARTPGATVYQDPTTPTSGYWRSLAVRLLGVTTDEVLSAGFGDTSGDPTHLVVPGNASVSIDGADLFASADSTGTPAATLPAGTRLRVVDQPAAAATVGSATLVRVQGLDDTSITGYMLATDLAPRDSTAPRVRALDAGGPISPNGDGRADQTTVNARFTETVNWTLRVQDPAAATVFQGTGTGATLAVPWNGLVGGHAVPDGTYTVSLTGVDAWGNTLARTTRSVSVDTQAPVLTALTPSPDTAQWFAPNGDGYRDTVALAATSSETGGVVTQVLDSAGGLVKTWSVASSTVVSAVTWDGRTTAGAFAPDGIYTLRVSPLDAAGNIGASADRSVTLIGALRSLAVSKALYFPNDLDSLARTTTLSFTLGRPMTVSWTVRNAAGAIVTTHLSASALAAGTYSWVFDGRGSDGAMLPRGVYQSFVTATDGTLAVSQAVAFTADAFIVRLNDSTPGRGQYITVTATSAESLLGAQLYVYQPGISVWRAGMKKIGTYTYRVTVRMRASRSGTVTFRVKGVDTLRGIQNTYNRYRLH